MLEYDKIEVSKGIDLDKTHGFREFIICHYWYFLDINFEFQIDVYNGGHNLTQKAMNFNDIAIATVRGNDYRIHFLYSSKDETKNLSRNANLTEKSER